MRRLLCPKCGAKWPKTQHPEDVAMGFQQRMVPIERVKKPPGLRVTLNGVAQREMPFLVCDNCFAAIMDGEPAVAVTQWRGAGIGPWEKEYSL